MNEEIYLIEPYHEGAVCPPYARLHSSVFSLLQKPANVSASVALPMALYKYVYDYD